MGRPLIPSGPPECSPREPFVARNRCTKLNPDSRINSRPPLLPTDAVPFRTTSPLRARSSLDPEAASTPKRPRPRDPEAASTPKRPRPTGMFEIGQGEASCSGPGNHWRMFVRSRTRIFVGRTHLAGCIAGCLSRQRALLPRCASGPRFAAGAKCAAQLGAVNTASTPVYSCNDGLPPTSETSNEDCMPASGNSPRRAFRIFKSTSRWPYRLEPRPAQFK